MSEIFPDNQHGFLPNRGTLTAWKGILSRAISKPDIYEFDYKGFFDNVRNDKVIELLSARGLPSNIGRKLEHIAQSAPRLPREKLIDETNAEVKADKKL